ncbi:hypothetical protein Bbelb_437530 [Branchiostoma belcheri]|nr:hypothetical protein Bbelb_437530 [Branchiostoma belcheri]
MSTAEVGTSQFNTYRTRYVSVFSIVSQSRNETRENFSPVMSGAGLDGNEVTKGMRKIQSMLRKIVEEETEFSPRKDGKKDGRLDNGGLVVGNRSAVVAVHIRCFIVQVGQIDTLKEEFTCDAVVEALWEEPQLNGATAEDIHWDDQWDPRIVFFNAVSVDRLEKQRVFFKGSSGQPWVRLTMHVKGTFKVAMHLFNFPFDHQELKIELMSDWSDKHMILCPYLDEKDAISTSTFTGGDEWYLHAHMMTCQGKTETEITGPDTIFPTYDVIINVTRRWTYYFWNIFVIMFLILLLTFSSFALAPDSLDSRLDVTLTLLLTSVAFKLVLAQRLPTISYLTLLTVAQCSLHVLTMSVSSLVLSCLHHRDIYILAVLTVQGLVVILHTTVSVITDKSVARLFNIASSVVLGVLVVLGHVALVIYIAAIKSPPPRICVVLGMGNDIPANRILHEPLRVTKESTLQMLQHQGLDNNRWLG